MNRKLELETLYAPNAADPVLTAAMPGNVPPTSIPRRERSLRGAIRSTAASLQLLTDKAQVAEKVEAGSAVVELDPAMVDPSPVRDRLPDPTDPSIDALVDSIRDNGQHVPVLVRHHPTEKGRFQVAYGHRRVEAARRLERTVRAIVRTLTDHDLVVAQGGENNDRKDTSFIERAYFALRLERAGFDRNVISRSLSLDKAELSRFLAVANSVPEEIVSAIGPAPKTGRARWLGLSKALAAPGAVKAAEKAIAREGFGRAVSDARFAIVLAAVAERRESPEPTYWRPDLGKVQVKVIRSSKGATLTLDAASDPAFADFVLSRMDDLYETFRQQP